MRFITTRLFEGLLDLIRLQPQYIEIEDTGPADTPARVLHQLNRIPRGARIVNVEHSGAVDWYRTALDDEWTAREIYVRFTVANARVLLEVF